MKRELFNTRIFVLGVLITLLTAFAGGAMLTTLMLNNKIGDGNIVALVYGTLGITAFAGGFYARQKGEILFVSIAIALAGFLIMLLLGLLFFEGKMANFVPEALTCVLGGCISGIIPKRARKAKRRRH